MPSRLMCQKCGFPFKPRAGYSSKCPKCHASVDPEQINLAGVLFLVLVIVGVIAVITGGITSKQLMHGMHAK